MKFFIKYRLKSNPTRIKKIGRVISITGLIIFLLADWVISPFLRFLPLELVIFAFHEIFPFILTNLWLVGLAIFFSGIFIESLNWRTGIVTLQEINDSLIIDGKYPTTLNFSELTEIAVFNLSVGLKRSVRFTAENEKLTLKFKKEDSLIEFIAAVTPDIRKYENIKMGNWIE